MTETCGKKLHFTDFIGQCRHSLIHKPPQRTSTGVVRPDVNNLGFCTPTKYYHHCETSGRSDQCLSRWIKLDQFQVRLGSKSIDFSATRQNVGTTHHRPFCSLSQHTPSKVQFTSLGSSNQWSRCSGTTRLARSYELLQSTILDDSKGVAGCEKISSRSNDTGTLLAKSNVDEEITSDVSGATIQDCKQSKVISKISGKSRTLKKQEVEDFCLESVWERTLMSQGWSKVVAKALVKNWAPTMINTYNMAIEK